MKSILLATTAIVAFAGAAAADGHTNIEHTLSGTLGYNDDDTIGEAGFYWEGNLSTTAKAELDNGLTAGAFFEITIAEDNAVVADDGGDPLVSSDFLLSLEAENAGMFYGDTGPAAGQYWKSAGDMEADGVSTDSNSAVLRGDATFGDFKASASAIINDANGESAQNAVGLEYTVGPVVLTAAYQDEATSIRFAGDPTATPPVVAEEANDDFNANEIYGISAEGTFAGATLTLAYARNESADHDSAGIQVAYPFGPVTGTAYYVQEEGGLGDDPNFGVNVAYSDGPIAVTADYQDDQTVQKWSLEGSYDLGNGLELFAGVLNDNEEDEDYYVAAKYDLGGGADFLVSYAEDDDSSEGDEIGSDEYQAGATVELNFSF